MSDEWNNCYEGAFVEAHSPEEFRNLFCKACRNPTCERAQGDLTKWDLRMRTQAERLLIQPKFGDPALAAKLGVPDFEPVRPAPLEIRPKPPEPPKEKPPEEGRTYVIRGAAGNSYTVTLPVTGPPTCTCKSFLYTKQACKHILEAQALPLPEPEERSIAPALPNTPGGYKAPSRLNTEPPPSGGIMVDGSLPPSRLNVDPWAVVPGTPSKPAVVPIGSRVILGGKR